MNIKKQCVRVIFALATLACLMVPGFAQQPQTSSPAFPPYNVKYVDGVGPGYWPTRGSGLTLNLTAGTSICSSVPTTYAGGTLAMTNNTTNYVYLNTASSCVPAVKTTAFVALDIPIAVVVTSSGSITANGITDLRIAPTNSSFFNPAIPGVIGGTTPNIVNATQINLPEQVSGPPSISATTTISAISSLHWPEFNPNGTGALRFAGVSGVIVAGHCPQFSDTVGTIIDNGTPCGGGGGSVTSIAQTFTGGLISVSGSPITTAGTLALTVAGTSGGVPYFSSASTWASSGVLTANLPVIGGGAGTAPTVGTVSGNTTEFGTVSGAMTSGNCLKADASGNIVVTGSACSVATVTSVAQTFTGGLISVGGSPVTTSGTLALTVAGTSGGIPYFSSASTWASSGALTANLPVIGGGAGVAPTVGTVSGNTTKFVTTTGTLTNGDCVSIDASGNFIDSGQVGCGGGGAGGTVTSVALSAPTGFTISGSPVVTSGTLSWALPTGWTTGSILLGNGSNSAATLLIGANGTVLRSNGTTASWSAVGSGTVTNVSMNNITTGSQNLATCATATAGTTPVITCTLANFPAHKFFMNNSSGSAAPDAETPGEADLPATTVFNDIINTYGAHLQDFSAATIKIPVGAGFTTSANGNIGYDTTNKNIHAWVNGADALLIPLASGFVSGHCGQPTSTAGSWVIADAGSACGSGGGATIQTNTGNNTLQTLLNFTNTSGAAGITFTNPSGGIESAVISTTTGGGNAVATMTATSPSVGDYVGYAAGPALVNITPGVVVPSTQTTNFTVASSMRGQVVPVNNVGGATTVTLPQANSAGFGSNFYTCFYNEGAFAVLVTPTTSAINWGGPNTTVMAVQSGATGCINSDNANYLGRIIQGQVIGVYDVVGSSATTNVNIIASIPTTGRYIIWGYFSQSGACSSNGGAGLASTYTWNDGNGTRQDAFTLTPTVTTFTGASSWNHDQVPFYAVATSTVNITNTYTGCGAGGPWTYDVHAWVVRQ